MYVIKSKADWFQIIGSTQYPVPGVLVNDTTETCVSCSFWLAICRLIDTIQFILDPTTFPSQTVIAHSRALAPTMNPALATPAKIGLNTEDYFTTRTYLLLI